MSQSIEASKVLAELIQSLGTECLDHIGSFWDLKVTAFNARYKLYSLSGRVLGSIESMQSSRAVIHVHNAYAGTVLREQAEAILRAHLAERGCTVLKPMPHLQPWTRGESARLKASNLWVRRLEEDHPGARQFELEMHPDGRSAGLYQNGSIIHTVRREGLWREPQPHRPWTEEEALRECDNWLSSFSIKLLESKASTLSRTYRTVEKARERSRNLPGSTHEYP